MTNTTIDLDSVSNSNLPTTRRIQASGSCYNLTNDQIGTLGIRVDRSPNNRYFYIATYHNFKEADDFWWVYLEENKRDRFRAGNVIDRSFVWGPDRVLQIIDCALVQLDSTDPDTVRRGVRKVTPRVFGSAQTKPGDLVCKFGLTTGFTFGKVVPPPAAYPPIYHQYLFFVEHTDRQGKPITSTPFSQPGDSGAPVMVYNAGSKTMHYVAGMVLARGANNTSVVSRIDQIKARLGVKVYIDS